MNILFYLLGTGIGLFVYSIGILQILISLFCSLPCTRDLKRSGINADYPKIYFLIYRTILLWFIIVVACFIAVYCYGNTHLQYGVIFGMILPFLFSLGKWGRTPANMKDYLLTYEKYIYTDENTGTENANILKQSVKVRYCKMCGNILDENKKCTNCGKQYFKMPKINYPFVATFALLICVCIYATYIRYNYYLLNNEHVSLQKAHASLEETLASKCENYEELIETLQKNVSNYRTSLTESNNNCNTYRFTAEYYESIVAFITDTDIKYHTSNCSHIENADKIYYNFIDDLESQGYVPCADCH